MRICLDPKDLNKAIIHENHKAPTLEEIAHILTGATKFSKVDGNKAFFGMHLSEDASLLTMFNTHLRRYRFLHVPFGLKMSQDIFQMRMDDIVAQCPSVLAIHDNVFIYGNDDRDHDINIINLSNVAQKGLIFNSKKCAIKQESITFFGGVFSAEGYPPDLEKIQGIFIIMLTPSIISIQRIILWSPAQRTPHPKAGRDTSLNQLSSDPVTLTEDSHMDFQPC